MERREERQLCIDTILLLNKGINWMHYMG